MIEVDAAKKAEIDAIFAQAPVFFDGQIAAGSVPYNRNYYAPAEFGLSESEAYQVHDLLTDARYTWHGSRNYVELDPSTQPAHIFRVRRPLGNGRFA